MYKQKRTISGVEYTTLFIEVPTVLKKFLKSLTVYGDKSIKQLVLNAIFEKHQKEYCKFLDDSKARSEG